MYPAWYYCSFDITELDKMRRLKIERAANFVLVLFEHQRRRQPAVEQHAVGVGHGLPHRQSGRMAPRLPARVRRRPHGRRPFRPLRHIPTRPPKHKVTKKSNFNERCETFNFCCRWYYTSDIEIREASIEEVLQCTAYMLFYEKGSNACAF